MSEQNDHLAIERHNADLNFSYQNPHRSVSQPRANFSPKKCWVCLSVFEMNQDEYNTIQSYFFDLDFFIKESKMVPNNIKLVSIMNKFILSICKCRKKLAHFECFQNYIDLKQNGNAAVDLYCSQCNFKYEFIYPLNSLSLKIFDFIDQMISYSSSILTLLLLSASSYWCCLSYGAITICQIYGLKKGLSYFSSSSKIFVFGLVPTMPIFLVASRLIPFSNMMDKLIPTYSINDMNMKLNENIYEHSSDDEEEKEDAKFVSRLRLVVGGLFLPTVAVSIDRMFLSRLNISNSALVRTAISGIIFIGVKNVLKTICLRKKLWQLMNRDIKNYPCCS